MIRRNILALAVGCLCSRTALANDTAAAISVGGIEFRREPRIAILTESLEVAGRISVAYRFENKSGEAITTEVAFPIPEYRYEIANTQDLPLFDDFAVEVDGLRVSSQKEVRAFVAGVDCTALLEKLRISIADFDRFDPGDDTFRKKLSEKDYSDLVKRGILSSKENAPDKGWPLWSVRTRYHWTQTFPPRKVVTVKHSYRPLTGYQGFQNNARGLATLKRSSCDDPQLQNWLHANVAPDSWPALYTVSYILKTAANWAGPIGKFHLDVTGDSKTFAFTCMDGVKRLSSFHLVKDANDFTPDQDLVVYFVKPN
jgi:hypothetical protein